MSSSGAAPLRSDHQPALDGLRGVSVALVLFFHGGFSWMSGGYVGVSVFFTLSGFLITGLLLKERDGTGRISASRFYERRVRRLMPASLLCLAAVSVAAAFGQFDGLPHLRRDIVASLFQVANWNALSGGASYADLVARSGGQLGPVDHFWSLAVEEQFYWVWPLVCMALLSRGSSSARRSMLTLAVFAVAAAPVIANVWGPDAAYWATPARLGEILVGAALAALLHGRTWNWRGLPWMALVGLGVVVWAAVTWPSGSGPAYSGWFGVFALAPAVLIAGLQPASPLRTALSARPLAYLGRISYGVYLYHWPVFAVLDERRAGFAGWGLFAVRMAITLGLAVASFHLFEQRLRHGRSAGRRVVVATVAAVAAVSVLVVAVVPSAPPAFSGHTEVPATFASTTSAPVPASTQPGATEPSVTSDPVPSGPATVLLLGDSTMVALSEGLASWASANPEQMQVASLAAAGCGLVRGSTMVGDENRMFDSACASKLQNDLPALLATRVPDVVSIMVTLPDIVDRTWSADEGLLSVNDPRYRERLTAAYRGMADTLIAAGVRHIAWVVPPIPNEALRLVEPDEWDTFVQVIIGVAAEHDEVIDVVRLDEWISGLGAAADPRLDGLHLSPEGAFEVSDRYLGELLVQFARS